MGLRTASVRHPHAEVVMAPALTETKPTPPTFKLPLEDAQAASPVNNAGKQPLLPLHQLHTTGRHQQLPEVDDDDDDHNGVEEAAQPVYCRGKPVAPRGVVANGGVLPTALPPPFNTAGDDDVLNGVGETLPPPSPPPAFASSMADGDAMGLRKSHAHDGSGSGDDGAAAADLLKTDVDLFDASADAADDIMQVFKSISGDGDLNALADDHALAADLFGVVDVMNMSIDDDQQQREECAREAQIKTHLGDVAVKHAKLERKFDFLLRRIRKHQMRAMGQHASAEVAGVFENVARTLKRYADDGGAEAAPAGIATAGGGELKPLETAATKNLIKKLELNNAMQANTAFRAKMRKHSIAGGVIPPEPFRPPPGQDVPLPKWPLREKKDLENVAGYLESEVRFVQEEIDSEATASSSGADSCDDTETYNNPHQQHLSITKRAAWRYATERAAIGSKWTWLQSQIADLEYKIRQYSELYRKLRANKEPVKLHGENPPPVMTLAAAAAPNCLNGYRGQLPGAPTTTTTVRNGESSAPPPADKAADYQCARTRPLLSFRKRKLFQLTGLHAVSKKAERPATMRCGCTPPAVTCALCTGRVDPTYPRDHAEYLSRSERMGLLDPCYHPVFSLNDAASASLHLEGIVRTHDWKQWSVRASMKQLPKAKTERVEAASTSKDLSGPGRPRKTIEHRKKNNRLIKPSTAHALSAKLKNRARKKPSRSASLSKRSRKRSRNASAQSLGSDGNDEEMEALGMNAGGKFDASNDSMQPTISNFNKRNRADSYDIDNIIIPFSVATTVRVEKLQVKEILTPKWRCITEDDNTTTAKHNEVKNNGIVKTSQDTDNVKELPEDLSDAAVLVRHEKSEQEERKKFLSYLKLPIGYGRSRANRRTDSLAESSGANTPDPMSPASAANFDAPPADRDAATSRPATPKPDEQSIAAARRRTISSTRATLPDAPALSDAPMVAPYEKRAFPLAEETYQRMVKRMQQCLPPHAARKEELPESQPPSPFTRSTSDANETESATSAPAAHAPTTTNHSVAKEHDSESTESAYGDDDPDPADPEWEAANADHTFSR